MINGEMAEAQRGFAILDDVDEETIRRFIEWAYKGYYTAATFRQALLEQAPEKGLPKKKKGKKPQKAVSGGLFDDTVHEDDLLEEPDKRPEMPAAVDIHDDLEIPRFKYSHWNLGKKLGDFDKPHEAIEKVEHQAPKNRRELKESFLNYDYKVRRNTITLPPTRGNLAPSEDYTDVFLSHARLYVFADMYDIQILKMLALEELHSTLANYTLYQARTSDVIALLRYVYANTSGEEGNSGGREIRKLLTDYMGCEMGILTQSRSFRELMFEDGGDLLGDFMKMVALRID